ncbi:MAG: glycosyltransferase [Marinobacter sp.]|uniref:glycosyltransferase n=1 Tax=Marinobacter sp. TaxID=50741 RepID=UPI0034A0508F
MIDQPLTIALIIATPGTTWGGMETHTLNLAEVLIRRGHTLHILAHEAYRTRFNTPLHFHPLPFHLSRRNPWLKFRLSNVLKSLKAGIHHAQGYKAAYLLGEIKASVTASRVGTVHGVKSSHRGYSRMDGIISVNRAIHERLEHPRKKLIYNGTAEHTDPRRSPNAPLATAPSPFTGPGPHWVAVGRLEPVKGFERLIRAWGLARPEGHLTIIGDGSERGALETLIRAHSLEQTVTLTGYQNNVGDWLRHACGCIISSDREGFSYVLIEALQAGCPVISTPVNGSLDLLPPKSLADNFSPEALAELVSAHADHMDKLRGLQAKAFRTARTQFTAANMALSTETFYRVLVTEKSAQQHPHD